MTSAMPKLKEHIPGSYCVIYILTTVGAEMRVQFIHSFISIQPLGWF